MNFDYNGKSPITHSTIYNIMLWVTMITSGVFFIKNIIGFNIGGLIAVGSCIIVLVAALFIMKAKRTDDIIKEFVLSIILIFVIMTISLFSGASYSDDFPLYLALIGMTGMYMEPKFTKIQIAVVDAALVIMYIVHPEKSGGLGQYILCFAITNLAAVLFYLAVNRGRAFIELSRRQTEEAERLIASIREMGDVLQKDFDNSSSAISDSTKGLRKGSENITSGANIVAESCQGVHEKIRETQQQISSLNNQVKKFEQAISENDSNMEAMKSQLRDVSRIIEESNAVFGSMTEQMNEVTEIAKKMSDISFKTTLLSLNASVEAANAGAYGAGFAVVAGEMKELSENSDRFAAQVTEVVDGLISQVDKTAVQFEDSTKAIVATEKKMNELQESFIRLTNRFGQLYENIDEQNKNVHQVDDMFRGLKSRVVEMQEDSVKNKRAVADIAVAMDSYRENIEKVIENTRI